MSPVVRSIVLMLALLLAACGPTRPDAGKSLKIATWNLEHLAETDGLGCEPRHEADYAALRDYATRLDADVIAFQEVESRRAAERVFTPDHYVVLMSERPGGVRHGFCRRDATDGPTIRKQDVGFAIRKGVPYRRHADVVALGVGNPDLRWGVDVSVGEGKRAVRLLGVHLKSGCSAGSKNAEACPILFEQAPVLRQWVDARMSDGVAFAILGDFNRRLALPDDQVWRQLNAGLPGDQQLADAAGGRKATCKQRYPDYIDHIVLGPLASRRMQPGSFEELDYGVPENRHPSDHCPVSVTLR